MTIERILGTDTRKEAFEKADRNFVGHEGQIDSLIVKGYANTISITDFNNATENGKYTGYSILNAPTTNSTVNVEVIKEASGVVSQIAVVVFGTGAGNAYTRIKQINGVWTAWQKIVTDKQEPWISPTLLSGWINFGEGSAVVGYYKDALGIIHFKGTVKDGTVGQVIFVLPQGYRPSGTIGFVNMSNGVLSRTLIDAVGNVICDTGTNVDFSLDNIAFRAEQ